ncbi:hypothetical protein BZA70DRAFT_280810 [Myxozyma melibiosi]|uniref:Uncharacterized protein n=1 Tax=Myxozyma melibiosi TaxID=54550 RepID=A0ABR1F3P5_9ASCO
MRLRPRSSLAEHWFLLFLSLYIASFYVNGYLAHPQRKPSTPPPQHEDYRLSVSDPSLPYGLADQHRATHRPQQSLNYLVNYTNLDLCFVSSDAITGHAGMPPCRTIKSLVESISSGGRVGIDAPYVPRDCAMWWYTTDELCAVMARYSLVFFIGDESLANVFGGLLSLLREDAHLGAVLAQRFDHERLMTSCACDSAYLDSDIACVQSRPTSVREIYDLDRTQIKCRTPGLAPFVDAQFVSLDGFPPAEDDVRRLQHQLVRLVARDSKPVAFVYSHGGARTNPKGFNPDETAAWLSHVRDAVRATIPRVVAVREVFLTAGATGPQVPDQMLFTHGLQAAQRFESDLRARAERVGFDVIGTWNATVQTRFAADGVHNRVPVNLLKATMVVNWLDLAEPAYLSGGL